MQILKDESGSVLKLSGALAIDGAPDLLAALRELLQTANPVLDLTAVDACDTAALQLLCSARKTGQHLQIVGVPDVVRTTSEALGLPIAELTSTGQ